MVKKSTNALVCSILMLFICLAPVFAADAAAPAPEDKVLFFVNEPSEMSFVEMGKIISYVENYYRNVGLVNSQDVEKFFQALRNHGAPGAGSSKAYVALVVQDSSHPSNTSYSPTGVLAVRGQFDKAKVIDILKRHYVEHATKTGHEQHFSETQSGSVTVHRFALPEKDRELTMISFGDYSLFASAKIGDTRLLKETAKMLQDKTFKANLYSDTNVRFLIKPDELDKQKLSKIINDKYEDLKQSKVLLKRKGLKGFFTRRFADHKVKFINSAIAEMNDVDFTVYRMRNENANMKRVSVVSTFANEGIARKVKKNILNHLNDAIKGASHPEDKLGLSNVKIVADGNKCSIETELGTEEEQLQCFALISSYVARSIIRQ
ncbi:MAG: hypothetical protein A2008_01090 [Candidatus Wallbacteria bacterium GWC2_49_35]|uniref:Uncharacterized protein n=1 Tax=Candidatus Wallbacteria bacterium GWC2_49_35 TaxID=1817813 RepID=A0A1F7WXP5_9BACT|nr:MAG: hypothetical protein A2008_01090 [Candidatus Wallbacteria bacterium GWC2_49_35]HBC75667.1 hypothetical protein [Candidatus Wallbacteria bacterium]